MMRGAATGAVLALPAARVSRARCMSPVAGLVLAACLALAGPHAASAQATVPTGFQDQLVVGGLSLPTGIAFLPDGRLLFVEQTTARIRLIVNDALAVTDPVATVPNVRSGGEQGLLGIAADPGFPARPYVYVHCDDSNARVIRVTRFTVAGDLAFTGNGSLTIDPATRFDVIASIPDVNPYHNGGTIRFGPDGMLYASIGEDGMGCAAQDTSGLRGEILRLDVSHLPPGAGGPPPQALITPPGNPFPNGSPNARLIWAFGLRNPFRFHIDPLNGALFIADVGNNNWEEIDRAPAGGLDFGWSRFEGPAPFDSSCVLTLPEALPIHSYAHPSGKAVIGAGLYRPPPGASRPFPGEYDGDYFFSDYYQGFLRRLKGSGTSWLVAPAVPGQPDTANWATGMQFVSDYAVGPDGSLWYCRQCTGDLCTGNGAIRRIVRTSTVAVPHARPVGPFFAAPFPAPSSGAVHFSYSLLEPAKVTLAILDLGGRVVRRLAGPAAEGAGACAWTWDGRDDRGRIQPTGVYCAVLSAGGRTLERRVVLVR